MKAAAKVHVQKLGGVGRLPWCSPGRALCSDFLVLFSVLWFVDTPNPKQNCTCLFAMVCAVSAGAALAILNDKLTFMKSGTARVKILNTP